MSNKLSFLPKDVVKALDSDKKKHLESENKLIKIEFQITSNAKHDYTIVYLDNMTTCQTHINEISAYIKKNCSITYSQFWKEIPFIELNGVLKKTDSFNENGNEIGYPNLILNGYVWIYIHDSLFLKFLKEEIKKL